MKLWVVGEINGKGWNFHGVFSSEVRAERSCKNDRYFVGPIKLNRSLPYKVKNWDGAYYPIKRY